MYIHVDPVIHRIHHDKISIGDDVPEATGIRHAQEGNLAGLPQLADGSVGQDLLRS